MHQLAIHLTKFAVRFPRRTLAAAIVLALAGSCFAAINLRLHTSNLDLVDDTLPEVRRYLQFAEEFGSPNVLVIALSGSSEAMVTNAVDQLGSMVRDADGVRLVLDRLPISLPVESSVGIERYLLSHDRKCAYIFVQPVDVRASAETILPFIENVRRKVTEAELAPQVTVGFTGLPVYALDDRNVIQHDIALLSAVALGLILLFFAYGFHRLARPLMAVVSLCLGVAGTLGLIAIYPGHLNLLSATFASIIFGLGIDYGIHLLQRHEELLATTNLSLEEAVVLATESVGRGIITGGITSMAVFLTMLFTGFRGFRELGIVVAVGILLSLLTTVTVLPALLVLFRSRRATAHRPLLEKLLGRLHHPVAAAAVLAFALVAAGGGSPGFDGDYLNLQPRHSATVKLDRDMAFGSDYSTQFAAFSTADRASALALATRLRLEATVGNVRTSAELEELAERSGQPPSPEVLRDYRSADGRYAVYAYPRGDVWSAAPQEAFIEKMRRVDPEVTGMPFLGSFMVERSKQAMVVTSMIGGLMMLVLVGMDFGRLLPTLLALFPTGLTMLCLLGEMAWLRIPFNPLSVMALPLVIGIAVDDGVHLVHRFYFEDGDMAAAIHTSGRGVLLTSLTTLAAFGTLCFTQHLGLRSLCLTICLGVTTALILTISLLPWALHLLRHRLLRSTVTPKPSERPSCIRKSSASSLSS